MPSGAKKRKALKKKKQQEAIGTSGNTEGFNGNNLRGQDEHGSQDERESDSNLSSPGSQGNEDPSAALSSGVEKGTAKEISGDADVTHGLGPNGGNAIAVERGTDYQESIAAKSPNSFSVNVPCQDACGDSTLKIAPPVVDSIKPVVSVSEVVISEKSEHSETTTHSNLVNRKSEYPSPGLEKDNSKVVTLPDTVAETSQKVERARKPQVPEEKDISKVVTLPGTAAQTSAEVESAGKPQEPEEKHLLVTGPPVVRTSWLSCCGLFDAMIGSDR